jgi:hypothetical protein
VTDGELVGEAIMDMKIGIIVWEPITPTDDDFASCAKCSSDPPSDKAFGVMHCVVASAHSAPGEHLEISDHFLCRRECRSQVSGREDTDSVQSVAGGCLASKYRGGHLIRSSYREQR